MDWVHSLTVEMETGEREVEPLQDFDEQCEYVEKYGELPGEGSQRA